jgi:hypothetical protein
VHPTTDLAGGVAASYRPIGGGIRDDGRVASSLEHLRPTSCAWCGVASDTAPLTWTIQASERGIEYLCEKCTRVNARNIEGGLPTEWW